MTTTREAALEAAAKNLVWAAQTSGGTAGRDEGLVAACDRMEAALYTPATEPQGLAHIVDYTNWRGETARRMIRPIRLWWGKTEWHPEEQWMLTAWDCEKDALRDFAWQDMRPVQNPATSAAARPAPQPAAEHEYPDPLIAEDRYEDDQPAADTRVVAKARAEDAALRDAARPLLNMAMWTESAEDTEVVIVTVGTVRAIRNALAQIGAKP